jgi:hypothetical protein
MRFWLILWTVLAALSYTLIRAGAKKQPKPSTMKNGTSRLL